MKQKKSEVNNQWANKGSKLSAKANSKEKDATNNQWTSTLKNSALNEEVTNKGLK